MDTNKSYREKKSGKYLGRFIRALGREPEGTGRGRKGTAYHFMPNNETVFNWGVGISRYYDEDFDIDNPPIPGDLEEVT